MSTPVNKCRVLGDDGLIRITEGKYNIYRDKCIINSNATKVVKVFANNPNVSSIQIQ